MEATGPVFAGHALDCVRGGRLVFRDLEFALTPGDALILRGPNASGKSSCLRLLAGLSRPAGGEITWQGASIAEEPEAHRARLHYVGHLDGVKPQLSLRENLAFWAKLRGSGEAVEPALARFELGPLAASPARYLSAGQRKRLALCRLVAAHAPIWLLDEPIVTLDEHAVGILFALIAEHRNAGGMAIVSAHGALDMPDASELDMKRFQPALEELSS